MNTSNPIRQRGFTLVELLVSIALGLLIMVALIAVYLNITRTNTEMAKTNSLIENGRFSIDLLEEDISLAGFWGGYVPRFEDTSYKAAAPGDAPSDAASPTAANPLDPCLAYANWATTAGYVTSLLGIPVQSFDVVPTNCAGVVTNKQADSDVLLVRHVDNCLPGAVNCEADTIADSTPKVYFQSSLCDAETEATPPLRYMLGNTAATFTLRTRGCTGTPPATTGGSPAPRRKFVSSMYYVRTYAVTAGDNIPTLMRASFGRDGSPLVPSFETPVALVEGVQSLAVEMGLDQQSRCGTAADSLPLTRADPSTVPGACSINPVTAASNTLPTNRGDGIPESYVRCTTASGCTNAQLQNVVAVKLFVLARSREPAQGFTDTKVYCMASTCPAPTVSACPAVGTNPAGLLGPFCDGYKRQVYQTTVRLTNVSGRRETP